MTRVRQDDEGSTLLLTIGYAAIALALIFVLTAATSLLIERRRLFTVADGAALAAAEAFALEHVRFDGDHAAPQLTDAAVREAAEDWVMRSAEGLDALGLEAATVDGATATVTVSSVWHPPLVSVFVPAGVRIDVTATARTVFLE